MKEYFGNKSSHVITIIESTDSRQTRPINEGLYNMPMGVPSFRETIMSNIFCKGGDL